MPEKKNVFLVIAIVVSAMVIGSVLAVHRSDEPKQRFASIPETQGAAKPVVNEQPVQPITTPPPALSDHALIPSDPVLRIALMKSPASGLAETIGKTRLPISERLPESSREYSTFGLNCQVAFSAEKQPGAMVLLDLDAPCEANETVVIDHAGMVFSVTTSILGRVRIRVPALETNAEFVASFPDGLAGQTSLYVPEVTDFDRFAIQWSGNTGLGIHATEYTSAYWGKTTVWTGSPHSVKQALQARGGYITELGDSDIPGANRAEVYSFPSGRIRQNATVRLSVEAEVTATNCGKDVDMQALQSIRGNGVKIVDLTVSFPGCDAIGDFLQLKNLLRDLKIARN